MFQNLLGEVCAMDMIGLGRLELLSCNELTEIPLDRSSVL